MASTALVHTLAFWMNTCESLCDWNTNGDAGDTAGFEKDFGTSSGI